MLSQQDINNLILEKIKDRKFYNYLTNYDVSFLYLLIERYPSFFHTICLQTETILSNNIIDNHDIPTIILLISNHYKNYILKHAIENVNLLNLVKFTIDVFLTTSIIIITESKLSVVERIIDSSLELLEMNTDIIFKEEICCGSNFI
jgi:hypothetical protein